MLLTRSMLGSIPLPSLEVRLALFDERGRTLLLVFRGEQDGLGEPLYDEAGLLVGLEAGVDGELGEADGERAFAEDVVRRLARPPGASRGRRPG